MKNEKPNAEVVWKQMADLLVPRLRLSFVDRGIYFHLVRHSRLEGKARLHFSIYWLARGTLLSGATAREAVRRLGGDWRTAADRTDQSRTRGRSAVAGRDPCRPREQKRGEQRDATEAHGGHRGNGFSGKQRIAGGDP